MGMTDSSGLLITPRCSVRVWAAFLLELLSCSLDELAIWTEQTVPAGSFPYFTAAQRLFTLILGGRVDQLQCKEEGPPELLLRVKELWVSAGAVKPGWEQWRRNGGKLLKVFDIELGRENVAVQKKKVVALWTPFVLSSCVIRIFNNRANVVVPQSLPRLWQDLDSVCMNIHACSRWVAMFVFFTAVEKSKSPVVH